MFDQLGIDLLDQIFCHVDPVDIAVLTLVNRSWSKATKEYLATQARHAPTIQELVRFLALQDGTPYQRLYVLGFENLVDQLYRWSDRSYAWLLSFFPRHSRIMPVMSAYRARMFFGLTPKDLQVIPPIGTCRCFFRRPFQVRGLDALTGLAFCKYGKIVTN